MLPENLRLDKKEIPEIARRGKKFSGELFDIKVWYDDSLENSKFAIAVSLKVDKRSTVRNRIKRVFRAAIVELEKEGKFRRGKYLFVVKDSKIQEYLVKDLVTIVNLNFEK